MSFVVTGYPVVIVENKNPGDSHALEHPAAQFMRCEREKLKLLGVPSNRMDGRMFRGGSGRRRDSGFVGDVEAGEPLQCRLAVLDRFVRGFEGEGGHFDWVPTKYGRVDLATLLYSLAYRRCLGLVGGRGSRRFSAIDLSLPVGHIHVVLTVQERNDE